MSQDQGDPPADIPEPFRRQGRYTPATLRAAWWAALSLRRARRLLATRGLRARIPPPPPLPLGAIRGVLAVLRRTDQTCLERSVVLQTWLADHGHLVDIIIGVKSEGGAVMAHAWMEGDPEVDGYRLITRIRPPVSSRQPRRCPLRSASRPDGRLGARRSTGADDG